MTKEYREFFIREIKVFTGAKADKELNFPVSGMVDTCNGKEEKYNRLLAQHYASDDVIKKFVSSIAFKLNPEDTASGEEQGLTLASSDEQAATNNVETSEFNSSIQSHQLPIVIDISANKVPVKYYDLISDTYYTDINDAIATGNPFVKAFVVGGGDSESNLLYGEAINPRVNITNNAGNPTIIGNVDIDLAFNLLSNGDIIEYTFIYECSIPIEAPVGTYLFTSISVDVDGTFHKFYTAAYTNGNDGIYTAVIHIQKTTDGKIRVLSSDSSDSISKVTGSIFNVNILDFPTTSLSIFTEMYSDDANIIGIPFSVKCETKLL